MGGDRRRQRECREETVAKGCFQSKHTPRLWPHKIWKILSTQVVDDIRVLHENEEDAMHLISHHHHHHPVSSLIGREKGKLAPIRNGTVTKEN